LFTGIYTCPCYYYPNRAGNIDRSSFIVGVEMKAGEKSPDHWVKRGTALLMSLDIWKFPDHWVKRGTALLMSLDIWKFSDHWVKRVTAFLMNLDIWNLTIIIALSLRSLNLLKNFVLKYNQRPLLMLICIFNIVYNSQLFDLHTYMF
jgi:hypothetical protein